MSFDFSSLTFPIRDNVKDFTPYSPGLSIEEIQEKYQLDTVIKLASNENPLGTSPLVIERLQKKAAYAFRYAQSGTPRLTKAIADHIGIAKKHIVVGNGSDEIIDLLLRVCPTPGVHNVIACQPCFSMYRLQSKLSNVEFRTVPLLKNFSFDWKNILAAIDPLTAILFLTTPDNPSGYCPTRQEVIDFARQLPSTCLLVLDEAYIDFCSDPQCGSFVDTFMDFSNVAILRTFSKIAGIAGLRLGYGIMPVPLANALQTVKPPFSVNILAEEAGLTLLQDQFFLDETYKVTTTGRSFLTSELSDLGCFVLPSQANFILFTLPKNIQLSAHTVFEKLLEKGIIIRPLASYDLPDYLRVSIGTMQENKAFITKLQEVIKYNYK